MPAAIHVGIIAVFGLLLVGSIPLLRRAAPGSDSEHRAKVNVLISAGFVLVSVANLLMRYSSALAAVVMVGAAISLIAVSVLILRRRRTLHS